MNPTSKKFAALLLIFSLIAISCTTMTTQRQKRFEPSKEQKHGAKLVITKKNGYQTEGELITVKPNSLLLLDTEGKDESVDIADIKVIRIVKKSKAWKYGLVVGVGIGLIGEIAGMAEEHGFFATLIESLIMFGLPVAGIVAIIEGKDKTIHFEGMSDLEIKEAMEKLRKKARIRDYK